ncbi:MAG: hypothetical protein WCI29_06390 [Actinomycetes bacterium]
MAESSLWATPIARSPIMFDGPHEVIDGWEVSTRTSESALTIADESHVTKVVVRATDGHPLSASMPPFGRTADVGAALHVGSAPGEWYLLARGATPESLIAALPLESTGEFASWVNVTHGRALMRVTGADTTRMLEKLCAVNLADTVSPNRAAFRTAIAGVNTDFIRDDRDGTLSYLIHCERSSGQYLFGVLIDAGLEFGIDPVGVAR